DVFRLGDDEESKMRVLVSRRFYVDNASRIGNKKPLLFSALLKRTFDLVFASIALIALIPIFILLGFGVKIDSSGPILFRQSRIGKCGKCFTIYKFRSMYVTAPCYAKKPSDDNTDPRITPFGRFLRSSGLDELPQFFNVLKGDMSIVGPRPEMPFIVEKYTKKQRERLSVSPGITGLWQISPKRHEPIHQNLQYDFFYIENRSFFLDLKIIGKTLIHTLRCPILILKEKLTARNPWKRMTNKKNRFPAQ
ncbi:MAG: sugar transferase, partial [Desulforhabdus sp.]|nr:sugar transferase [Desulforhabdus sp.]